VRRGGLDVDRVDARVADERVGHGDDLPAVRCVGQDLLVAGHRRVEADLAVGGERRAERLAAPDAAVFKRKEGRIHGRINIAALR